MKCWKIKTDGGDLLETDEGSCRDIFSSYCEWWNNPTSVRAAVLEKATNGIHPARWSRPVELVNDVGEVVAHYPPK